MIDRDQVCEVLAYHQLRPGVGRWLGQYRTEYTCECGAYVVTNAHAEISRTAALAMHQTDVLMDVIGGAS